MSLTNAFTAKRAIIGRLAALAAQSAPGGALYQAQVSYGYPGPPSSGVAVYGADPTFTRGEGENLTDGKSEINEDLVVVGLVARVAMAPIPPNDPEPSRTTDVMVAAIGDEIDDLLRRERDIAGADTYAYVIDGRAANLSDESRAVSSLLIRVGVDSHVTGG